MPNSLILSFNEIPVIVGLVVSGVIDSVTFGVDAMELFDTSLNAPDEISSWGVVSGTMSALCASVKVSVTEVPSDVVFTVVPDRDT